MKWNVLYLKPRTEKKMARICEIMGVEYYLPLRIERKTYQRRAVTTHIPVFPSYFFAQYDREHLSKLKEFNLLLREMESQKEAILVHELDQIKKALAVDSSLGADTALKKGLMVRITDGPFTGIEGRIEKVRQKTKVSLDVNLINQAIRVEVEGSQLEILD
jgi:transcription antitermination factor NusG